MHLLDFAIRINFVRGIRLQGEDVIKCRTVLLLLLLLLLLLNLD